MLGSKHDKCSCQKDLGDKPTHGGKRPGAGRKAPDGANVVTTVSVTPEVKAYLDTRENRSVAVEEAVRQSKQFKQWKAENNAH